MPSSTVDSPPPKATPTATRSAPIPLARSYPLAWGDSRLSRYWIEILGCSLVLGAGPMPRVLSSMPTSQTTSVQVLAVVRTPPTPPCWNSLGGVAVFRKLRVDSSLKQTCLLRHGERRLHFFNGHGLPTGQLRLSSIAGRSYFLELRQDLLDVLRTAKPCESVVLPELRGDTPVRIWSVSDQLRLGSLQE